jgi:hypothetical protein
MSAKRLIPISAGMVLAVPSLLSAHPAAAGHLHDPVTAAREHGFAYVMIGLAVTLALAIVSAAMMRLGAPRRDNAAPRADEV